MFYIDGAHQRAFVKALHDTCALNDAGRVNSCFGASLYLLTSLGMRWQSVRRFVTPGCIDFDGILDGLTLSSGESVVVRLAGNLYNGQFGRDMSPIDLIGDLDNDFFRVCLHALEMRRGRAVLADGDVCVA